MPRLGMLLIFMCSITFSMGTAVSLEDRLTKLETKFFQIEEKNIGLEEKVTELEARNAQLKNHIELNWRQIRSL